MKDKCAICEQDLGIFDKKKVADGLICVSCGLLKTKFSAEELRTLKAKTVKQVAERIDRVVQNEKNIAEFVATKKIRNHIFIDENNKTWLKPGGFGRIKKSWVFRFADIKEFELLENGNSVSSGGLGRAVVGGILLGPLGAVVGGMSAGRSSVINNLQVKVTTKDIDRPAVYINFVTGGATYKANSFVYKDLFKSAQDVMSTLSVMTNGVQDVSMELADTLPAENNNKLDKISELREYKKLLDEGIITQADFDEKKKELLSH